jgi:hypothetical protein
MFTQQAFKGYNIYGSQWATYNQTYDGVNPPNPYVIPNQKFGPITKNDIIRINSRDPYAVEHLNNGYGTLQTKLGTNLGTRK